MGATGAEFKIDLRIDPETVVPGCVTTAPVEVWRYHTPLARSTDGGVYYLHRLAEDLAVAEYFTDRYGIRTFYGYNHLVKINNRDGLKELEEYVQQVGRAFVEWQSISGVTTGLTDSSKAACVLGLAAELIDLDGTPIIRYPYQSIGVWSRLKPEDTALRYNPITHDWEPVAIE